MKKAVKFVWYSVVILLLFCVGTVAADKGTLRNDIIRLHVIANSDSAHDQNVKLAVRDAVVGYLQEVMADIQDADGAKEFLTNNIANIQAEVSEALSKLGEDKQAAVMVCEAPFDTRVYETFSLPAGVYNALQIRIGDGAGKNWWCVVFPSLCIPVTTEEFTHTAVMSGMNDGLAASLAGTGKYKLRFYILDYLGKLENSIFGK